VLEVKNLFVQANGRTLLKDVSFSVSEHMWLMVVGPNGAGKTTLVNAITQGLPYEGDVRFDGRDVANLKSAALAKCVGMLTQNHPVAYSFTVEEVVRLGRYAYAKGMLSARSDEDEQKIEEALSITGMQDCRTQSVLTLSGGELQRAFLAQVFAQDPRLLILDEPTNNLDLVYQKQVFELIREWAKRPGRAVISVMHDLVLARAYGSHAILLDRGNLIASGTTKAALSRENLLNVYSMDVFEWTRDMLSLWG